MINNLSCEFTPKNELIGAIGSVGTMIFEYLLKFHLKECIQIVSEADILGYFFINIDFLKLFETFPDIGDKVLCQPIETLHRCNVDLIKAQKTIIENDEYKNECAMLPNLYVKKNVQCRFFGLPVCPELHRTVFPKNVDLGCFLKVTGTVVRVTQAKMLEYHRKYVCVKCKYENLVEAEFEQRYVIKSPIKCGNPEHRCKSTTFTQINLVSREFCKDYQEIKIQEQVNKLSIGTIPGSMWVILENDLVDCCKPGDDVNICGTVRRRWRPCTQTKKSEVELVLQGNHVEVCNSQKSKVTTAAPDVKECFDRYWTKFENCPLRGRDQILISVCPQVYGLHVVKLALLITVITGANHISEDTFPKKNTSDEPYKTKIRGQCHLLLVGDPGTGKSQLLRAGADLTPRSVFTSGTGSTRAGLTCSALREDGEWQLEAGALVLADGGACCVDEFSRLRDHDRASVHEAMEQQTISIAKAGIVCKLNTRCAIIAACNPKGNYDISQPLSVNVSIGTPLLSRFDLIFILLDSKNRNWDELVSSYILFGNSNSSSNDKLWNTEKLQMYISLVGPKTTKMTKSANVILQTYYMKQRMSEHRDPSRTTVRMLDSLVRLSQAHCRLMYRNTILPMDAITAISLVDLSMQDCTLKDTMDALHSTFPKHPDYDYLLTAKSLLMTLNLGNIWKEELLYYAKILQVDHKTLESELQKNSVRIFSKFDDVVDDNIPLSCSIVTSTYFKKKDMNHSNENTTNTNQRIVEIQLPTSLNKHAVLNTVNKAIDVPKTNEKIKKRKREVTTADMAGKSGSSKKVKCKKTQKKVNPDDSQNNEDCTHLLNAVPSVNDELNELKIKLELDEEHDVAIDDADKNEYNHTNDHHNHSHVNKDTRKDNSNQEIHGTSTSRIDKLKQFQFIQRHNMDKYLGNNKVLEKNDDHFLNVKIESEKPTLKGSELKNEIAERSISQISIFESSNCDIDIDL